MMVVFTLMLKESDLSVLHALSNVRYQKVAWLLHQTIESTDFEKVFYEIQTRCAHQGLTLTKNSGLMEQSARYFAQHGFFQYLFLADVEPDDVAFITVDILKELRFISSANNQPAEWLLDRKTASESMLLNARERDPCFLKVNFVPFGGPINVRPNAVFCIDACLTNVADIWRLIYFPLEKPGGKSPLEDKS